MAFNEFRSKRLLEARHLQVAALVHRQGLAGREILLITSRQSRRWVLPKGWPHPGLSLAQSALQEAWEEAGVRGVAQEEAIGRYGYAKRIGRHRHRPCDVLVFPVRLVLQSDAWPEASERALDWVTPLEASRRVAESELAALLHGLDHLLAG
ncbi:MAG: NUDIX hydrolase [Hyphomicrobiales bacterium]